MHGFGLDKRSALRPIVPEYIPTLGATQPTCSFHLRLHGSEAGVFQIARSNRPWSECPAATEEGTLLCEPTSTRSGSRFWCGSGSHYERQCRRQIQVWTI